MLYKVYKNMAELVAELAPEIQWIDLDKGQLETPDDFHSVQVPGLLLGLSQIQWQGSTRGSQMGLGTLTASLVMRLPLATYQGAKESVYPEFETLPDKLHGILAAHASTGDRRTSDDYFTKHFYVYVQTYDLKLYHNADLKIIDKPAPAIQATVTIPQ